MRGCGRRDDVQDDLATFGMRVCLCRGNSHTNHEGVLALVATAVNIDILLVSPHEGYDGEYVRRIRKCMAQVADVAVIRWQRHLTIDRSGAPEGFLS